MIPPGSTPRNIAITTINSPPMPPPRASIPPPPPPDDDAVLVSICIPSLKVIAHSRNLSCCRCRTSFAHQVLLRGGEPGDGAVAQVQPGPSLAEANSGTTTSLIGVARPWLRALRMITPL